MPRARPYCVGLALHNPQHTHTFHEVSILIALALFEQHGVQWAAMETGVGGRYDQTRALDVHASVLTNIGSDHAHMLGDELWVCSTRPASRAGAPFFTSERNPESLAIVGAQPREGAGLHVVDQAAVEALTASLATHTLEPSPESLLHADYQKWNAALALAVVRQLAPGAGP